MSKLDRSKPFGIISGASDGGCYEQDGITFDSEGNEIGAPVKLTKAEQAAQAKAEKEAAKAAKEQSEIDKQIAAASGENNAGGDGAPE